MSSKKVKVLVIWQSLVVRSYRSFFWHLAKNLDLKIELVTPREFTELGGQSVQCAPFQQDDLLQIQPHILSCWSPHPQIVFFRGLRKVLANFSAQKTAQNSKNIILIFAEPYSITAFIIFLTLKFFGRQPTSFYLMSFQNIYKNFSLPISMIQKLLFSKTSGILCLNEEVENVLRRHGYSGSVIRFPLWFDSDLFKKTAPPKRTLLKKIRENFRSTDINESIPVVSFCGSLTTEKGINDYLECIRIFSNKHGGNSALFLCAGKGPLKDAIESAFASLREQGISAFFLDALKHEDVVDLFSSTDVFVIPSRTTPHWKEQFGRVIIEAWACGAMAIGSSSGEIPNLIGRDEWIFQEGDAHAMADTLFNALKNRLYHTSENMIAISKKYSDVELAKNFADFLRS